jgi:predicted phosphodiesterase
MRVAIVSDIHGNRQAFEAVLAAIRAAGVDATWCLGDLVGYGADPDACVALAVEHTDVCLAGNHDLAVTGAIALDDFSTGAGLAARWTIETISREARDWLAALAPAGQADGVALYHASPRDAVWEYVLSVSQAAACLDAAAARVSLIGHSHVALAFHRAGEEPTRGHTCVADHTSDVAAGEWLLNPGSVGQPRDGDARAAWMLLDLEASTATWRRELYDLEGAAAAIRAAGLPDSLAERLSRGQ